MSMNKYSSVELLYDTLKKINFSKEDFATSKSSYNDLKNVQLSEISHESFQDSDLGDKIGRDNINKSIDVINALADVEKTISKESMDFSFTSTQKKVAAITAMMFNNKKVLLDSLSNSTGTATVNANTYSPEGLTIEIPSVFKQALSSEAYDGTKNFDSVYYNIAVNVSASRQDDFAEAFFPTVAMSPEEIGISLTMTVTNYVNDFIRSSDGKPVVIDTKSMIKHAFDTNVLLKDKTKIIPKYIESIEANKDKFLKSSVLDSKGDDGQSFKTGALAVNKEIDIIGLSYADGYGLNGSTGDRTDALYPSIKVMNLYFNMKTENSEVQLMKVPVSGIQGSGFLYGNEGHFKSVKLSMQDAVVPFKIGTGLPTGFNEVNQDFKTDLTTYKGFIIEVKFSLSGSARIDTGTISINPTVATIVSAKNAQGGLATSEELAAIKTAFKQLEIVGYDLEAYVTNTNLRHKGQLLQIDADTRFIPVPYSSGFTIQGPTVNYTGTDNDITHITSSADSCVLKSNADAIKTLFEIRDDLAAISGVHETYQMSSNFLTDKIINPYFVSKDLDVVAMLDSLSSSGRMEDIREALSNYLMQEALSMYSAGYMNAHKLTSGKKKATVLIGTDIVTSQYLLYRREGNLFSLSDELDAMVVWSPFAQMNGKIFMTFSTTNKIGEIEKPDLLHFGFRAFSPIITVNIQRSGSTISNEQTTIPRYKHIGVLPILAEYNIKNLPKAVEEKVSINTNRINSVI